jgi:uncharacterized protein YegL
LDKQIEKKEGIMAKKAKSKKRKVAPKKTAETVHIVAIIDRSGSMYSIKEDAKGGFNKFLDEQKALPGKAVFTLAQFDDKYDIVHDCVPLKDVGHLTDKTFVPRGMTALYDAIGKTIAHIKSKNPFDGKKKQKVIVVITTDGQENASHEHTSDSVKVLISECRSNGWEFVFTACAENAMVAQNYVKCFAASTGIDATKCASSSRDGTQALYATMVKTVSDYRTGKRTEDEK